jgi:hypothetical protein
MELGDLVSQVADFDKQPPREQIRLFAWWLHVHRAKETFVSADIRACYDNLHMSQSHIAQQLTRMVDARDLVKVRGNFKLERAVRTSLDARHGMHHSVVHVSKLLTHLPQQVPNVAERAFLAEALKCYRIEAYRACIVMTWNLAYSHLLDWVLADQTRLDRFNAAISRRYPKKTQLRVTSYDEFLDELKESEVLEICNTADLYNSNIFKILKDKLNRRNIVAHPSTVVVVQSQADDAVTDLVNNVVLALT